MFQRNNDEFKSDRMEGDHLEERSHVDRSFLLKLQEESVSPDLSCHWVRRSTRKPVTLLKKDRAEYLSNCLHEVGRESCLEVFNDPIKGRGVKAGRFFRESEFVAEYKGRLIDGPSAENKEKEYAKNPAIGCYMYYLKYAGTTWCIDATEETDSKGRLINHSRREPNLRAQPMTIRNGLRELFHDIKVDRLSVEDWIAQTDPSLILLACVTANAPECQDFLTFLKVAFWTWEPEPCKTLVIVCNLETEDCSHREEIMKSLAAEEWIVIQDYDDASAVYKSVYDPRNPGLPRMLTLELNLDIIDNTADRTLLSTTEHSDVLRLWIPNLPPAAVHSPLQMHQDDLDSDEEKICIIPERAQLDQPNPLEMKNETES